MKNKIDDLRNHLFATLESLRDEEKPMDIDRAKAIADVARVIVDSAVAEVKFLQATGRRDGTGFVALPDPQQTPDERRLSAVAGGRACPKVVYPRLEGAQNAAEFYAEHGRFPHGGKVRS